MAAPDVNLSDLHAVILAGGFGTRVKHLLPGIPKPMAPVAGRPFLEWVVRYLAKQGIRKITISTGFLAEIIAQHFQKQPIPGVAINCVPESTPLGTAGGFLYAAKTPNAPPPAWLVLNGDSLVFADLTTVVAPLKSPDCAGVILGRSVSDAARYGTLAIGPLGELKQFEEKRPGSGIINSGVYLLPHATVANFPPKTPLSFENDVFPTLLRQGQQLRVITTEAPFLDIGTPETLAEADAFIGQNLRQFVEIKLQAMVKPSRNASMS